MKMTNWFASLAVLALAMLFGGTAAHAQTCNAAQQVLTVTKGGGQTASATIPGDGYPNSGCSRTFIDYVQATLLDNSEDCAAPWFQVVEGTNTILFQDGMYTRLSPADSQIAHLPPLPPPLNLWYNGHAGGLVQFTAHCANSSEFINVFYHYQP